MANKLKKILPDLYALLFLLSLCILFFWKIIFSKHELLIGSPFCDLAQFGFASKKFYTETIKNGFLPFWCPLQKGGIPFFGMIITGVLYPLNLIFLISPLITALNITILFHLWLSGFSMYLFSKKILNSRKSGLFSAVIFMLATHQILKIYAGHTGVSQTIAWIPLFFLFAYNAVTSRKSIWAILLGALSGISILAGYIHMVYYTFIFTILFILFFPAEIKILKRLYFILLFIATGLGLSAIQWTSIFETLNNSIRSSPAPLFCGSYSLPPVNLLKLILPDFLGNDISIPYYGRSNMWEMSNYIGIIPLFFIIYAIFFTSPSSTSIANRKGTLMSGKTLFFLLALLSLIFSIGRFSPFFNIFYHAMPGFNLFRGHCKAFVFVIFFLSIFAGIGLSHILNNLNKSSLLKYILLTSILLLPFSALLLLYDFHPISCFKFWIQILAKILFKIDERESPLPQFNEQFILNSLQDILDNATILLVFGCIFILTLFFFINKKMSRNVFYGLILLSTIFDLWLVNSKFIVGFNPNKVCYLDKKVKSFLEEHCDNSYRIYYYIPVFLADNFQFLGGYDPGTTKRFAESINLNNNYPIGAFQLFTTINKKTNIIDLYNTKYFVYDKYAIPPPGLKPIYNTGQYIIYENPDALPKFFTVHKIRTISDRLTVFSTLISSKFNPKEEAIVEESAPFHLSASHTSDTINMLLYNPNKISLNVDMSSNGLLIVCDNYFPGWRAFVDKKEKEIIPVNYAFRGIYLEKGRHYIEFKFKPRLFTIGLIISIFTLFVTIFNKKLKL